MTQTSDPSKPWDNSSDILQGIMGTRAVPPSGASQVDLSSDGLSPSDLTLGDPASFLGFQFASEPAIPHPSHPSILQPWPLYQKQTSSPLPQLFDASAYPPLTRWRNDQEAWNPLQVTGGPIYPAAFVVPRSHQVYGLDRRSSSGHHSTPSEAGSQYTGIYLSDSGYSTQGCTTRSVAASYALESACSPFLAPLDHEQDDRVSALDLNTAPYGDTMDALDRMDSPPLLCQDVIKCDYPGCQWTGKCPSDKRCVPWGAWVDKKKRATNLTVTGNTKLGTRSSSNATSRTAPAKRGSVPSTTLLVTRSVFTSRSRSEDQKSFICASDITARAGIRNGPDWTTFVSILLVCTVTKMSMSCYEGKSHDYSAHQLQNEVINVYHPGRMSGMKPA